MGSPAKLGLLLLSTILCERPAHAQLIVSVRAGLIDYTQGNVYLDSTRLGAGIALHQMQPGQTISTGKGRAEVLLSPGIMLRLGDDAAVRINDTRLEDTQVAIEKGSAFIEVVEWEKDHRLRVYLGDTEIQFKRTGLYRFDSAPARLRVYGGEAGVGYGSSLISVKTAQAVDLHTIDLIEFAPSADSLHTWSAQRSFTLFNTSSANRNKQKHWKYIGDGWLWNRNYQVKYHSVQARRDNAWGEQQMRQAIPNVPRADTQ